MVRVRTPVILARVVGLCYALAMKERLEAIIVEALRAVGVEAGQVTVECPADSAHGDYATNVALVYGKRAGVSPRELAGKLSEEILRASADDIAKVEVAGPGFINFFLTAQVLERAVFSDASPSMRMGERVVLEFVSANPTGALHLGHGRGAFFGDTFARVLAYAGAEVVREYYINDSRESNQVRELGKTALGRGEQYKTPALEEMMRGMDFGGLSEEDAGIRLAGAIQADNRAFIEQDLGIQFDSWYSEDGEIRASGASAAMLALLKERGETYEKDGALWLKTSAYGDDEDRVIVRSDGTMTYFVSDIAYHQKKFDRGFNTLINVWGADHHGHVKRMQAVGRMLGWLATPCGGGLQPTVFIAQMVSLKEDGVAKKMSKRAGNVILLRDLVTEFGIDVVRWFFNEKALGTQMAFDMALAREQSEKNPVYYVQYAHARLASILEKCRTLPESEKGRLFFELMEIPAARSLALAIVAFPDVVSGVARDGSVHALAGYATGLAQATNAFYRDVRVVADEHFDPGVLALAIRAKKTLADTLALLGISAPEKM